MNRIKNGDRVLLLRGKDKKKTDVVDKVVGDRVFLRNLNAYKKHQRANPTMQKPGGIITKHLSVHISNVALINAETNKPARIGFKINDQKQKVRFFKSSNKEGQ